MRHYAGQTVETCCYSQQAYAGEDAAAGTGETKRNVVLMLSLAWLGLAGMLTDIDDIIDDICLLHIYYIFDFVTSLSRRVAGGRQLLMAATVVAVVAADRWPALFRRRFYCRC